VTAARVDAVRVAGSEAAELGVQLAEALIQHELEGRDGAVDALRRAMTLAPDHEQTMELRIHPGDAVDEAELRAIAPGIALTIIGDPKIEVGGCVLTAGPCRIDGQIGPAVARARAVIADFYTGTATGPADADEGPDAGSPAAVEPIALGAGEPTTVRAMGRVA
jgi:flagellar biosynthesis/type III secretory pathway protein FliH